MHAFGNAGQHAFCNWSTMGHPQLALWAQPLLELSCRPCHMLADHLHQVASMTTRFKHHCLLLTATNSHTLHQTCAGLLHQPDDDEGTQYVHWILGQLAYAMLSCLIV